MEKVRSCSYTAASVVQAALPRALQSVNDEKPPCLMQGPGQFTDSKRTFVPSRRGHAPEG